MKKPTSITVIGRRWFQRLYGNTYHTAQILVDGETVHTIPMSYGYGDMWAQNAAHWLDDNGYVALEPYANGNRESLWRYCENHGIAYTPIVIDVTRKRDL